MVDTATGVLQRTTPLGGAMSEAERKASIDAQTIETAKQRARPKPLELQVDMSAETRQELATEKFLLDGFFKAKLQNSDQEIDLSDILMIRNLQAVARHMVDRTKARS